ncbi:MAG: YlbF family regulator [Anaeroplasmataceae bacterium]|nr:YlbF family regulator [Anaeroplasmataceae bacterium]
MNDLKQAVLELPLVKRIQELESVIDSNQNLNLLLNQLKEKQQQMINAKEYHQTRQYKLYEEEYNSIYNAILDYPFVEEYLDLLEQANNLLLDISGIIDNKINSNIIYM